MQYKKFLTYCALSIIPTFCWGSNAFGLLAESVSSDSDETVFLLLSFQNPTLAPDHPDPTLVENLFSKAIEEEFEELKNDPLGQALRLELEKIVKEPLYFTQPRMTPENAHP